MMMMMTKVVMVMMMTVYLVSLSTAASRPHELHDGHKDRDDEATDKDHEDPTNVFHAQTSTHTRTHTGSE